MNVYKKQTDAVFFLKKIPQWNPNPPFLVVNHCGRALTAMLGKILPFEQHYAELLAAEEPVSYTPKKHPQSSIFIKRQPALCCYSWKSKRCSPWMPKIGMLGNTNGMRFKLWPGWKSSSPQAGGNDDTGLLKNTSMHTPRGLWTEPMDWTDSSHHSCLLHKKQTKQTPQSSKLSRITLNYSDTGPYLLIFSSFLFKCNASTPTCANYFDIQTKAIHLYI